MIKVFSAEQIRAADQFTIKHEPISSLGLMERAAEMAFKYIKEKLVGIKSNSFSIVCGVGNNAGDGLVIARKLAELDCTVKVYLLPISDNYSNDFSANLKLIPSNVSLIKVENWKMELEKDDIIIDAIFGTGLNRAVQGNIASIIQYINSSENYCIAIDIPSGMSCDQYIGEQSGSVIQADLTLTFQFPKSTFFLPEYAPNVGQWEILKIGLHESFIQSEPTDKYFIQESDIKERIKSRDEESHKGTYGHALLCMGSKGKIGAAIIAAKACLRSGVGLLTMHVPSSANFILQTVVPEAMLVLDKKENIISDYVDHNAYEAVGVGCGIGADQVTQDWFSEVLNKMDKPMLIDADGINIISMHPELLEKIPPLSIITPHLGEFKRLVGEWKDPMHRLQLQIELSKRYKIIVVLKGRNTSISDVHGNLYFNSTGNSGMATGGSGDALSGIITALLAQNYSPLNAAIVGVYLHGFAGDLAVEKTGKHAMIASDIIDSIADAYKTILEN